MPLTPSSAYLGSVLPGIEEIAAGEVSANVTGSTVIERLRGKVVFTAPDGNRSAWLERLRTFDNIYLLLARFPVGPHRRHLDDLEDDIARLDLSDAETNPATEGLARSTFYVNAGRSGRHTFSRFEAAEAATRGILRQRRSWSVGDAYSHDREFRLDVHDEEALFSLRLTPAAFRYRGAERHFAPAALRPPVAHALVLLSNPQPFDRFLDPCCGSGVIVEERLAYPARLVAGGDISWDVAMVARTNTRGVGRAAIARWDAGALPLDASSMDKVATNLPFGRQVSRPNKIPELYRAIVGELSRVVASTGSLVLLTDQIPALRHALDESPFQIERSISVSLKGLHPSIVVARR